MATLIIESPKAYSDLLGELFMQQEGEDGNWVLSEGGRELTIKKYCEIIMNPFQLDLNQRKMLTKLYEDMEQYILSSELQGIWNGIYPTMVTFMENVIAEYDFSLEYVDVISVKDVLKFLNLHFTSVFDSVTERIIEYMELSNEVLGTKLFVFVNLKSFLDENSIRYVYEKACYKKFQILLLENKDNFVDDPFENITIYDKDGCIIQKKMS